MRHDDPDKTDKTAHRYSSCRAKSRRYDHDETHTRGSHPDTGCFLVTDGQHVEQPPAGKERGCGDCYIGQHKLNLSPSGRREPTEDPAIDQGEVTRAAPLHEERLDRYEKGGNSDSGEQHRGGRAFRRAGAAQCKGGHNSHDGTEEGGGRKGARGKVAEGRSLHDHDRCACPSSRGDPEQVGVRQRVGKHALVGSPGHGQHRPHDPTEDHTRHP